MSVRLIVVGLLVINCCGLAFNVLQEGLYHQTNGFLALNCLLSAGIWFLLRQQHQKLLRLVEKNSKGNEPLTVVENYLIRSKALLHEVHLAIAGVNEIGHEKFSAIVQGIDDETIRNPLLSANEKIIALRKKENEHNWITLGVASIADLKHKENDIADYSYQVISAIVKYINANQGGLFLLKTENLETYFELTAVYAYGKKKYVEKRINPGEGLLGELFYGKEIIYTTEVPKDFVKITSGLGEALPRCICIVPLLSEGKILGAIELSSFNKLGDSEMEFLTKIAERVGHNLNSIESHKRTERLLEESQQMALEVKAQEEELRQNMEQLQSTQKQMNRKQAEMDAILSCLPMVELDLEGKVTKANPIFLGITGYVLKDIQGQLYRSLIPQQGNDLTQYEMIWSSILSGRSFSGEFRIVNKGRKEMWIAGNFTPILNDAGQPYKVMVISLFTTQDKEKLLELQQLVTAMKNYFPMAEINPDMTFKTANDLFLSELGIKRLELKGTLLKNVLANGSHSKLETFLSDHENEPHTIELSIHNKNGATKTFNTSLIKIGSGHDKLKKGLLILRNAL